MSDLGKTYPLLLFREWLILKTIKIGFSLERQAS